MKATLSLWDSYISGQSKDFVFLRKDISQLSPIDFVSDVISEQSFFSVKDVSLLPTDFPQHVIERVLSLINTSKQKAFPGELLDYAVENGYFEVDSVLSNSRAKCSRNFFVLSQFNFLEFEDEHLKFYVVQRVKFAEVIWIPSLKLVFTVKSDNFYVQALKSYLSDFFCHLSNPNFNIESNAFFSGVIASFKRPFHYFYQVLSGLQALNECSSKFYSIKNFYCESAGRFINVPKVFGVDANESIHSDSFKLTSFLLDNKSFAISSVFDREKDYFAGVEKTVVNYVRKTFSSDSSNFFTADSNLSSVSILLAVMAEGRTWVEQVEGFLKIIQNLSKSYGNVNVFIDGLTSPEGVLDFKHPDINKYLEVYDEISSRVPENVTLHNLIGVSALNKIKACLNLDYFLTDMATSSMFVSRFAKISGVGHCNSIMNYSMHRHFDIVRVPCEYVDDLEDGNQFRISYSMDPIKVADFFLKNFNDHMRKIK